MSEIKYEVRTFIVKYICDRCHEGEMVATDLMLLSYPSQYPHVCSKCGERKNLDHDYPRTVMEQI